VEYRGRAAAANRLIWVAAAFAVWAAAIFARLIILQVIQHEKYSAIARSQQEHKVAVAAPRGTIFDRNGQALAISVPVDSVSVNPMRIASPSMAASMLASILHLDHAVLLQRLQWYRDNHKGFMWVKRRIDPFETARLKALNLDWVSLHAESVRHYPKGETAAHLMGAVFSDESGAAGLERSLDKLLAGREGEELLLTDVKHRGIESHVDTPAQEGQPLTLTIDERIQFIAERELKAGVERKHARSGTAIVMNPYNGEILALANYPTYDPNKPPTKGEDPLARVNLGVLAPFEPGSLFKMVTLSAALETTDMTPETLVATGNGVLKLPGRIIHESHGGYGTITMQQVFEKSSNIGAILIGTRVGREHMYEYARKFGFGQVSGLPIAAESAGRLRPLSRWGTTSLASISMGHEVSTTSVQLARAGSVFANGGMLVSPKLVLRRGDKVEPDQPAHRILQPDTVMKMRLMMEGVVLRGTARGQARLDGYTSAGKTGTAQIFDAVNHRYTHLYNASFMGFTPVVNPKLVIVVTLNGTAGDSGMGASAAAPVFKVIATETLRLMDVQPDIPEDVMEAECKHNKNVKPVQETVAIADLDGGLILEDDADLRHQLRQAPTKPDAEPPIPAAKDVPDAAETPAAPAPATVSGLLGRPVLIPAIPAPVEMPRSGPQVPDFRGKSLREVVEEASAAGIELSLEGSGVARAQLPPPGAPLHRGETVRIVLTR
jgi:cell division protein FtsI (penicillin-binding protein 3)